MTATGADPGACPVKEKGLSDLGVEIMRVAAPDGRIDPRAALQALFSCLLLRFGDRAAGSHVGLGLAIARGFVEAMGGTLVPSRTPGGGLTMTLTLPRAAS